MTRGLISFDNPISPRSLGKWRGLSLGVGRLGLVRGVDSLPSLSLREQDLIEPAAWSRGRGLHGFVGNTMEKPGLSVRLGIHRYKRTCLAIWSLPHGALLGRSLV